MATRRAKSPSLRLENLEQRNLMAGDIAAVLDAGVLQVTGTNDADTIQVRQIGDTIQVAGLPQSFAQQQVKEIVVYGLDGNDSVLVDVDDNALAPRRVEVRGGSGNDRIQNGSSNESELYGEQGNDVVVGGSGADYLSGADGNDFIMAGRGDDIVVGGNGNDQIFGGLGNDRAWGEAGFDLIHGEAGNDTLDGGTGDDKLFGGDGADLLFGGAGYDMLSGNTGDDQLVGGDLDDQLFGGADNDTLWGESGNDVMFGGSGIDTLYGGSGANTLEVAGSDGASGIAYRDLSDSRFAAAVDAVMSRWKVAGVSAAHLANIQFRAADLPDEHLGLSVQDADGKRTVWIDADAGGAGWFVDVTPSDNTEFQRLTDAVYVATSGPAANRMDLVTVLGHEIGHMAGLEHTPNLSVMSPRLDVGVRMVPEASLAAMATGRHTPFIDPMFQVRKVPTAAELIMLLNNLGRLGPQATSYDVGQAVINTRPQFLANNGLGWVNNVNGGSQTAHALMFSPYTAIPPGISSQYGMINPHVYAAVQNYNQYHNQGYGATNFNFHPLGNLGQVNSIVGMLQGVNVGVPTLPIAGTMVAGFGAPIGSLPQHQMHNYGSYGGWF